MPIFEQLASLISWHRQRAGLRRVELARHAGVSHYAEKDLETGVRRTTWARMEPDLRDPDAARDCWGRKIQNSYLSGPAKATDLAIRGERRPRLFA